MTNSQRPPAMRRDRELESDDTRFQIAAAAVISGMFTLLKVAMVHRMDNKAVEPVVKRFEIALQKFQSDVSPDAALQFVGDACYINRRLIRADVRTWERARFVERFFSRMNVAEIAFSGNILTETLRDFVQAVREVALDPTKADSIHLRSFMGITFRDLSARGVGSDDEALVLPDKFRVLRGYGIIAATLNTLVEDLQQGKRAPLLPIRRAIQEFVRLPDHTRPLQLGLLSLEQYRDRLAGRLANVGVLVVLMGKRMGLGVADLRDMGVAAALSGIGRAVSDELVFAKPDMCAAYDAYLEGARWLVPYSGRGKAASLRLIAAAEQMQADTRKAGHPLSRLVAVADQYDLWTQRPPRGPGMEPHAALTKILEAPQLDRRAARLLVATIGMFPVGSTVKLSSGETAVVVDVTGNSEQLSSPRVLIIADAQGASVERRALDLGGSGVSIAGTVNPMAIDLNVGHFLFA